jgi:hypothetical protein
MHMRTSKPRFWLRGFVSTVVCGAIGWLVSLQGGDPSNVALGMALVGGCAYLVGFVQGEGEGERQKSLQSKTGSGVGEGEVQ